MATPSHHVAAKAKRAPVGLSVSQVAEHLGITAHVLRMWEHRYGWPKPKRHPNGYRCYPRSLVAILERVSTELKLAYVPKILTPQLDGRT